ncbi:FAD-binding oxidoreductase [Streptomyces sp. NPDC002734]|uniref:FAD-binding oxidoreductase n=1 Tax=Streptomyces sp. NPDC002734 TaxID=3154426 RepID=UPI00332B218A
MSQQFARRSVIRLAGAGVIAAVGAQSASVALGGGLVQTAAAAGSPALLLPGDPGFDAERSGFNPIVEHHPRAISVPTGPADVAAAVGYARDRDWPIAVQTTGHGISVAADGALLVNTRLMDGVQIDRQTRTARIGAGVRWGAVVAAAAPYGLAPLSGSSTDVGVVGYVLGGGLGLLGRTFGYAADRVRSLQIVTADGRIRTASPTCNPELFWGARGGKSNFGVVTGIEIELMPVARVYGGALNFAGAQAADVLEAYRQWSAGLSEQTTTSLQLLRLPDDPVLPPPLRGQFIVSVVVGHLGDSVEGDALLRPLRALAPFLDTVQDLPFADFAAMFTEGTSSPQPLHERTGLIRTLDARTTDLLVALAGPDATLPAGVVSLRQLGGALGRPAAVRNAVGLRDADFALYLAHSAPAEESAAIDAVQQGLMDGLRPALTGGAFPNFLGHSDTAPERVRAAYRPADYRRLVALKRLCDPGNLFRINHNIPPR